MAKNIFLDSSWQQKHIDSIKNKIGKRYMPKLNVELPISEIFESISRTNSFYTSIRKHYGNLAQSFDYISSIYENYSEKDIKILYQTFKNNMLDLLKFLSEIRKYNTKAIPWPQINQQVVEAQKISREFLDKLRKERDNKKLENKVDYDIHWLSEVQNELRYFEKFSKSTQSDLSNHPFLLLTGKAGAGKTHLLCDLIESRIKKSFPSFLFFGEEFLSNRCPFEQIIENLALNFNQETFLSLLNNAAKNSKSRAVIAIDALNETYGEDYWRKNLGSVIEELKKYKNIGLIVSVRIGFESQVLTDELKTSFIHEEHHGFLYTEWEAVSKFFKEFNIPFPEIPLLRPEFQNPLFLLLFCKAFENFSESDRKDKKKDFRGHIGATYIFEEFVKKSSEKISNSFNLNGREQREVWDKFIKAIAQTMSNRYRAKISREDVVALVKKIFPSVNAEKFIKELENNLLLVKIGSFSDEKFDDSSVFFKFPFQKFSDHLIARYFFNKHEEEVGKKYKNIETVKFFFSKEKIKEFLISPWNRGIVKALSVQCPERFPGYELVNIAPYLRKHSVSQEAFIESLIWRELLAFKDVEKNTLPYICSEIIKTKSGHNDFLDAILTVTSIPKHYFNANFLHDYLSKFSMAERDAWWSTFLHDQYGERKAVDRLIEWGWSEKNKKHIHDNARYLCCITLSWFLTTSNRVLRDQATKAIVTLLTNKLNLVLELLKKFKDVNDSYVSERLYAVAYGCAIRSQENKIDLGSLAKWIYEHLFKSGNLPMHILLRDYARGVIEIALHNDIKLEINREKIEPPFNSHWPRNAPSIELLKNKYYSEEKVSEKLFHQIWNSILSGDFECYIIRPGVDHWRGRKLKDREINRNFLLEDFKNSLDRQQLEFFELSLSNLFLQKASGEKLEGEVFISFEKSLSDKKKKFFKKEIKPFLNEVGIIVDPQEYFNEDLAKSWILNRVIELGWKPELHGEFDKNVNFYRQNILFNANRFERIGKKYQWIALHEFLGMISDHFEFKNKFGRVENAKYQGSWQIGIRDIDPSSIIKKPLNEKPEEIPSFINSEQKSSYKWDKKNHSDWVKNIKDLPNPKNYIEISDDEENLWMVLEGNIQWREEALPECNFPLKTLSYMLKSYLVKSEDKEKVFKWAKQQDFMGRWMPESSQFFPTEKYLGEYPWASASFCDDNEWRDIGKKTMSVKVLVTDDQYLHEPSIDCSNEESIKIQVPAKFIIEKMNLKQKYMDGRFFDKQGDLVAFDPNVFNESELKCVLIKKNKLCNFLRLEGYSLFWTLLGEKNVSGGDKVFNRLKINGVYTFDDKYELVGSKKSIFDRC
jgi:DNA replication protein DnaC